MDFAYEISSTRFWCSWSNSGRIALRRWYESLEGVFFFMLPKDVGTTMTRVG